MGTELDLDLYTLVGDMPDEMCEALSHATNTQLHGEDKATHYAQKMHPCAPGSRPHLTIFAVCARYAEFLSKNRPVYCTTCGQAFADRSLWVRVVGPIS